HTNKQNLQATIDTYWIQAGGGDFAEWCRKLKRCLPMIYMKDFGVSKDNKTGVMMEVGAGNFNWQAIILAAEKSGCEWFIVEQDICPGDFFDSIRASYQFIKEHLAERIGR
ncbi:MAG TPA: sugar phosphate isomerase/epimerase, partial [Planctomycetota bacterium]|nr:sugar phosphate isomerase/epimerase [Planctomycetota bacterium]